MTDERNRYADMPLDDRLAELAAVLVDVDDRIAAEDAEAAARKEAEKQD